jgi:hypothetical protein
MDELISSTIKSIEELNLKVNELFKRMSGKDLPISFKDGAKNYKSNLNSFSKALEGGDSPEKILSFAKTVAVYVQVMSNGLNKSSTISSDEKSLVKEIQSLSVSVRNSIEHRSEVFDAAGSEEDYVLSESSRSAYNSSKEKELLRNIDIIKEDHEKHDQRHQKLLAENFKKIQDLEGKSESLQSSVKEQVEKAKELYESALKELTAKREEVNKLLGVISGSAISGSFEQSANDEKGMADWLRYASLVCMALIVIVIGYSFWETTTDDFKWENSVFRIVLAFLLSVPSAYLARESAKHREQQYNHLQTSLDLKSIDPYVASLPIEQQHKIKADVAGRIFAAKDFSRVGSDPYPLNTHEIVMEMLKKIDFKQKTDGTKKPEKS